ncbi:amino acid adenylation domain-containing protein [Streptomyces sp. NPDC046985]|uniref:amino acid adenylation domain-containing protein n=1 Tax=Streptomyces sp. NPDC046985 TaxID=3155377 RepID=UPI0033FAA0AF
MSTGQQDTATESGCYLFPASSAQQRMYFLDRALPDSTRYHVPLCLRIRGDLDTAALRRAVARVHGRHEALRTHLVVTGDGIQQAVDPDAALDWEDTEVPAGDTAARDWTDVQSARGFDLETGPLMRAALARVAGRDEWILLLAMHHLVVDGWSVSIIVEETLQAYRDEVAGRGDTLPQVEFDYPDYAAWQQEWLESPAAARQTTFWREALAGRALETDLPADRPHAAGAEDAGAAAAGPEAAGPEAAGADAADAGAVHVFEVPAALTARLRAVCAEHRTTLSSGLLALYGVLLHRLTGQRDIVVGTPVAGRTREEFERTVGLFVNTLALPVRVDTGLSFGHLAGEVGTAALDAYDHQELPFERVVEALAAPGGPRPSSMLRAFYVMQNTPRVRYEAPGLEIEPVHGTATTAKFDLNLEFQADGDGLRGIFEYRTGLFRPATVAAFAAHLLALAERAAAEPDVPLATILPSADSAPRPALPVAAPDDATLLDRVRRWARETPDAAAVSGSGRTLTYRELLEAAENLARRLLAAGVRRGDLVGLCADRDVRLVVGMIGIQAAGAAYVPLDPVNPATRLRLIAQDAGLRVAVVAGAGRRTLRDGAIDVTTIDTDADTSEAAPDVPLPRTGPGDTAYVIYTSGSTGRPKGTLVSHRNVGALLDACDRLFTLGPADVWSMFHSFGFDFAVWEVYGALASGARVVVVPYEVSRSPEAFWRLVADEGVTVLSQTPTAFRQLQPFAAAAPDAVATLRYVVFGGEALDPRTLREWVAAFGTERPELVNMYGITETTVHVTHRRITVGDIGSGGVSPIGVPLPHLDVVVLDASGQQVPAGVPGEVVVRGAGLADGYLDRPALTAERFVPDPFGGAGARMYRSGDLARTTGDGELVFAGRADDQVKVRGFRIEPGEVEAAFSGLPGVRDVAVVVMRDDEGDYLCAAVVTPDGGTDAAGLRAAVARRLPGYMVPRDIVPVSALPLTPNGKLDRAALRAAVAERRLTAAAGDGGDGADATADGEPTDATERVLLDIWRDVLDTRAIGTRTNYYAAGGDSIRSIRISAAARARGLHVDVAALLHHPTIAELAPHVRPVRDSDAPGGRTAMQDLDPAERAAMPADVIDAYPITSLQGGMLFESAADPRLYHNVTRNRVRGTLDEAAWRWALEQCVARHEILRTSFHVSGYAQPLQLVHRAAPVRFRGDDLGGEPAEVQERRLEEIFEEERATAFDVTRPGLLRLRVARLAADSAAVFVTEHHAVLDGWSEHCLVGELIDLYLHRIGEGGAARREPPTHGFGDYVALERRALADPAAREFWRACTADPAPAVLPHAPASGRTGMRTQRIDVPAEVGVAVARTARALGVSVRIVLLAAHLRVMNTVLGQDDVITGVVYNGRPETAGGDELIGLFLNTVPFRVPLHSGSWAGLIAAVAEQDAAVQPHRRYPLRRILTDSGQERLFETFFNFTNFHGFAAARRTQEAITYDADRSVASSEVPLGAEFSYSDEDSTVHLTLRHDTARFDADFLTRLGGYYVTALTQATGDPDAAFRAHTLLSADELKRLEALRGPQVERRRGRTLHGLIEERLRARPHRIAALAGERRLTAGDLAARSTLLAAALAEAGVRAGDRVAVCLPRSEHLLTAVLGVLKAGAAYVPVDPEAPDRRCREQAEQAGVRVVVTAPAGDAPSWTSDRIAVPVPDGTGTPAAADVPEALPAVPDTAPAYVIFTSGSTGRPKGVAVNHAAIVNRLEWMQSAYPIGPEDRVLHKTPFTFDVSVWELFWPLLADATTVVARPGGQGDPAYLAGLIERERVNVLHFVPSMLDAFLAAPPTGDLSSLRHVFCSGEALTAGQRDAVHDRTGAALHNLYGPTEAAVDVSHWECRPEDRSGVVPIGHPIDNTVLHIVDSWGLPCPWGAEGEILISGAGLATGYVGAPALTAAAFVAATGADGRPLRGYLTGDIGRLRPDGAVEFRGRRDDQVKVRGVRVELAEVESAVATAEGVADVRAAVVDDGLVAYVTPASGDTARAALSESVRETCRARLPHAMVPSAVVVLDRLPLTASGKLDRRALPKPRGTAAPGARHSAPGTPLEREVAAVWADVLGVEEPGRDDDFFHSGGHSLAALRLVALLDERLGARLHLSDLLDSRTIRALAARIEPGTAVRDRPLGTPARPRPEQASATLLLAPPVGGHALGYAHLLPLLQEDFDVVTVEALGLRPGESAHTSVPAAAARLVAAAAHAPGPLTLAGWSDGGLLAWEAARQIEEQGRDCRVVLIDTTHPDGRVRHGEDEEAFRADLDRTAGPDATEFREVAEAGLERMLAVFSANRAAADSYTAGPLGRPVLYVQARHSTTDANVRRWRKLAGAEDFRLEAIDTDHYALVRPPWVKALADAVRRFTEAGTR